MRAVRVSEQSMNDLFESYPLAANSVLSHTQSGGAHRMLTRRRENCEHKVK